jgi:hypothetical protein
VLCDLSWDLPIVVDLINFCNAVIGDLLAVNVFALEYVVVCLGSCAA